MGLMKDDKEGISFKALDTRDYFDAEIYEWYKKPPRRRPSIEDWSRSYGWYLRGWLPEDKDSKILEIGCGEGNLLAALKGWSYTRIEGLELREDAVSICRRRGFDVKSADGVEYLRGCRATFQVIFLIDIIEHLTREAALELLRLARGVLAPNGSVVIQTPNLASPFGGSTFFGDATHKTAFTPVSLRQIMACAGFSSIEIRPTGPGPWSFRSGCYWLVWGAMALLFRIVNHIECSDFHERVLTRVMLAHASI